MAGFGPWARSLVDALGFSHTRHGRMLMWCLQRSLSTNSSLWVPPTCLLQDCLCKRSRGSPAHPHEVEVTKSDTESGHVASLYSQPRYSHVPVIMFLLSMLILLLFTVIWWTGQNKAPSKGVPAHFSPSLFSGPNSAHSSVRRGLLTGVFPGPHCAWDPGTERSFSLNEESGCSHTSFTLGYNEKSVSAQVRNINGISLSSVVHASCAFINVFQNQAVSMENSSFVWGGLISVVFTELGIQSSHLFREMQQKIWYYVKKLFPGKMASSLAKAS